MGDVAQRIIYIVDDDDSVREALSLMFELDGFETRGFASGDAFFAELPSLQAACVLLDIHMPGRSGIDILSKLAEAGYPGPVFMISGQGDIPTAVQSIKRGATDFIEKPFDANTIIAQVREALATAPERHAASATQPRRFNGFDKLTQRELQVMWEIVGGSSNKEAGQRLGISSRTVEVHRARIMDKLGARNAADLVRIALQG